MSGVAWQLDFHTRLHSAPSTGISGAGSTVSAVPLCSSINEDNAMNTEVSTTLIFSLVTWAAHPQTESCTFVHFLHINITSLLFIPAFTFADALFSCSQRKDPTHTNGSQFKTTCNNLTLQKLPKCGHCLPVISMYCGAQRCWLQSLC